MLEQQCWLWGQDVRHQKCNMLMQYGFERARPPQNIVGASAYQLRLLPDEVCPRERAVALWGFGIWYGEWEPDGSEIGGVFIGRADFGPRWSAHALPPQSAWIPAPINAATGAPQGRNERRQARNLLSGALSWIADYESWALTRHGHAERVRHLEAWQQAHAATIAPAELVQNWRALASRLN